MTQSETAKITYSELVEKLRTDPDLKPPQRRDMASAVTRFVRRFVPAGMGAPIIPSEVSAILSRATPAKAGLREGSFSTMICSLRRALRRYGIITMPGRHTSKLGEQWGALMAPITNHTSRTRLSRLFQTANRLGWKPQEISGDHFRAFHQELQHAAVLKNIRGLVRDAIREWNRLAAQRGDLPQVDVALPRAREPYTLTWDKYPPSLREEIQKQLDRLGNPSFLSADHRPALKPRTIKQLEWKLRMFCAGLVHRGRNPEELTSRFRH